jgi:hypothetical protein
MIPGNASYMKKKEKEKKTQIKNRTYQPNNLKQRKKPKHT